MPVEKFACQVPEEQKGQRLDQFLARTFSERFSRRRLRRLIETGAVYVDSKRVRVASRKVHAQARVELYLEEASPTAPVPCMDPSLVLFEDDYLIAIDKPSGVPAQATVSNAVHDLFAQVRRWMMEREPPSAGQKPPYLALHHRLDRGTSGVMLFSKQREANRGLAQAFSEQRIRKVYHALGILTAPAAPTGAWTVSNLLSAPREIAGGPRRVLAVESEGRPAETEFRPLQWFPGATWIEAIPKTGRTHQIRVHLSDSGLPVLGDKLYGRDALPGMSAPRLMLHALSLTLQHPVTGQALCIESPLPEDFRRQVEVLEYKDELPL